MAIKFQQLLDAYEKDRLTKEDFLSSVDKLIAMLDKRMEKDKSELDKGMLTIAKNYTDLKSKFESYIDERIGKLTKIEQGTIDRLQAKFEATERDLRARLAELKDGDPGDDADEQAIYDKLFVDLQKPIVETIENDLPQLGTKIRDGLELLQGDERLKIEAIKDLREELDELKKWRKGFVGGTGVIASSRGAVRAYDISGLLDGVTKTFALPAFWRIISVHSSSFPQAFRETVDWTSDGSAMTITFTSEISAATTLASGQTLVIVYAES